MNANTANANTADTDNAKTAETNSAPNPTRATGPKTKAGKAVAARNATTHGLFCRQTVLPHLGEDPAAYAQLLDRLKEQLRPRNLMEEQYLELWADASWKLRRLSRLEAQLWENDSLDEDQRLTKLERLSRLQASTRRQLDKAVRMLTHDVHDLFAHRTREDVLHRMDLTEAQVAEYPFRRKEVEKTVQANSYWLPPDPTLARSCDSLPEQPNPAPSNPSSPAPHDWGGGASSAAKNSQNEPPAAPSSPHPLPDLGEGRSLATGVRADAPRLRPRVSRHLPPAPIDHARERRQNREELLNNPQVPLEERRLIAAAAGPDLIFTDDAIRIRA